MEFECPSCSKTLSHWTTSGEQQLLCNMSNEGGVQKGLDILPLLTEEVYLKSRPKERRCRAFLEFCREGDIEAIASVLRDEEDEGTSPTTDVLRYQDPTGSLVSGLHVAVQAEKPEVVWLLLLLASNLDLGYVPPELHQALGSFGLMKQDQTGKMDIRSLTDADGKTAAQLAASIGGIWSDWIRSGRLGI